MKILRRSLWIQTVSSYELTNDGLFVYRNFDFFEKLKSSCLYSQNSVCFVPIKKLVEVVLRMYVNVFRYKPDVIKGDMDSIRPDVLNFYVSLVSFFLCVYVFSSSSILYYCIIFTLYGVFLCF